MSQDPYAPYSAPGSIPSVPAEIVLPPTLPAADAPPVDVPAVATAGVMPTAPAPRYYTRATGESSPYPLFYDSCAKVYPATANRIVVYGDAGYGPAECIGYPPDRHRYEIRVITREGGAAAAQYAGILDYEWTLEAYTEVGAAREFAETRAAHKQRVISYCPRALLGELLRELGPALWHYPDHRLWIPTLDDHQWSPDELAADIASGWGIIVEPWRIWGNQFGSGGPRGSGELEWDESSLFRDF